MLSGRGWWGDARATSLSRVISRASRCARRRPDAPYQGDVYGPGPDLLDHAIRGVFMQGDVDAGVGLVKLGESGEERFDRAGGHHERSARRCCAASSFTSLTAWRISAAAARSRRGVEAAAPAGVSLATRVLRSMSSAPSPS